MNTRSSSISCIGVPASSAMYSSARWSPSVRGSGTDSVTWVTISGVVPQVTWGDTAEASISTSVSNSAPSSVRSASHSSTGIGTGAAGRPSTHSRVVSSGATIPARPPASMVMLHMVMRPSMESASIGAPAYSIA